MNADKKSKRQLRREQMSKQNTRNRLLIGGIITLVAAFFLYAILRPILTPIAEVVSVESRERYMADGASMGDPNAPIQMTEYSDFQCPFCKRHYLEVEPLLEQYYIDTGKVLFTYRSAGNFVSQNIGGANTESADAAEAAYCAADQGKFWQMHDALFENNRDVENGGSFFPPRLSEIAAVAGLDVAQFEECFDDGKYEDRVTQDLTDANADGLQGTPYFIVTYVSNGETKTAVLNGAQPFSEFQITLEAILNEIGAQ